MADCLETTIELGEEYREMFSAKGGDELTLVESLKDDDAWVKAIKKIIQQHEEPVVDIINNPSLRHMAIHLTCF